jgi:hypothetical protein
MKVLIIDSGPLINLSINGLLYLLKELRKDFKGKFIITPEVKREVYDRPVNVQQFELGALRIQGLIEQGILEFPPTLGITVEELEKETDRIMGIANHSFKAENHWLNIVSRAETSCLALASILVQRNVETMIAIDERTARIMCERPDNLEKLMSKKLHKRVRLKSFSLREFRRIKFIRSSELVYVAYKKGLVDVRGPKALEALIYATKYKGSSISNDEINVLKKI